jgi:hypothetical protein
MAKSHASNHGAANRGAALLAMLLGAPSWVQSAEPATTPSASSNRVTVPFEVRRGHIMVPARVNGSNTLSLLLDTGYGMTMLSAEHVESFALKRTGRITIVGIAGEEPAGVFEGPPFDFAGMIWKPRRVAAFPAESQGRSRRRDGILGSAFFRRYVVAIDPTARTITLHEPDTYNYSGDGEVLPLAFQGTTPIVEAGLQLPDQSEVTGRFEIDIGCDACLCLGRHFVEAHQLVPTNSAAGGGRVGVGGGARTRAGHLPWLQLGKQRIEKPAANFFVEGSPVDAPLAGHIGWALLRDFKVVFDYSRKQMILERSLSAPP